MDSNIKTLESGVECQDLLDIDNMEIIFSNEYDVNNITTPELIDFAKGRF